MNIVYIASVRIPNEKASGLAIMRQCEAFANLKHSVTLLRPNRKNHIKDEPFEYYGIEKNFLVLTLISIDLIDICWKLGFYATRLSQMIGSFVYVFKNQNKIDLVYSRDPWLLLLPVIFLHSKKIIWEAHQMHRSFFVRYVASRVSSLVCISLGLKTCYEDYRKQKDILVEPSGVNLSQFEHLPTSVDVRKRFNIPQDKKVIGYIGKYTTMGEGKGVDSLIQAFATIYKNVSDICLVIVGLEQAEIDIVKSLCQRYGIDNNAFVLLPLIQKDFAKYVQATDILVMNYPDTEHYRTYMSPTKLFAYMASSKTLIVSDLLSVREIVDESMVLLVKPDNIESLQNAILSSLKEDSNLEQMRQRALKKVQKFSWEKRASRILSNV